MTTIIGAVSLAVEHGVAVEITQANPKHEIRNPKQTQNPKFPKSKTRKARGSCLGFRVLNFRFVSDFVLRISDFVLRISYFCPETRGAPAR
jgi:hypothetical protein